MRYLTSWRWAVPGILLAAISALAGCSGALKGCSKVASGTSKVSKVGLSKLPVAGGFGDDFIRLSDDGVIPHIGSPQNAKAGVKPREVTAELSKELGGQLGEQALEAGLEDPEALETEDAPRTSRDGAPGEPASVGPRYVLDTVRPSTHGNIRPSVLDRHLLESSEAATVCFRDTLAKHRSVDKTVFVYFMINVDGSVKKSDVIASGPGAQDLQRCLQKTVDAWRFPPIPQGGYGKGGFRWELKPTTVN